MIRITERMREENPYTTEFCEIINEALKNRPNMSLADFAKQINEAHTERAYRRIQEAEKQQFGGE